MFVCYALDKHDRLKGIPIVYKALFVLVGRFFLGKKFTIVNMVLHLIQASVYAKKDTPT